MKRCCSMLTLSSKSLRTCSAFFFTVEVLIRFLAFKNKRDMVKDAWCVFDTALVVIMVFETWFLNLFIAITASSGKQDRDMGNASILRLARLLRLTRMARMARL